MYLFIIGIASLGIPGHPLSASPPWGLVSLGPRLPGDPWPSPVGIASLGPHLPGASPPWDLFREANLRFREAKSKHSKVFDSFDSLIN